MRGIILKSVKYFDAWILYYLILGIIQALWTNVSSFPPQPLRIAMTAAVFGPVLLRKEIILFAIPFSMTLRGFLSTQYSYLPTVLSHEYYIGILLLSMAIHIKHLNFSLFWKVKSLIVMMLYFTLVDIISNGEIGNYAINIFIGLLLIPFIKKEEDFHFLSAALIAAGTLLAIYYIIMFDKFLVAWESSGLERSGWSDPNYFATMMNKGLLVAVMYLFGFCKSEHSFFNNKILVASCLFIATAVSMTASRGGFIGIVFILIIAIFTAKLKFWHFLLASLVITAAFVYMFHSGAMDVLIYRLFEQSNINTAGDRTTIWKHMLENFGYQNIINQIFGGGYWHRGELTNGADSHNEFFSIMADYGVVGLLLFVSFFFSICSFRKGKFWKHNLPVFFYFLATITLSPFQTIFILFLVVWIYALKFNNDGIIINNE